MDHMRYAYPNNLSYRDAHSHGNHSHSNRPHGNAVPQPYYSNPWTCMGNPDPMNTNLAPPVTNLGFQTPPYCSSSMYTANLHALSGFNPAQNSMAFQQHAQGYSRYMFTGGRIEKVPYTEPVQYHRAYNHNQRPEIRDPSRSNFQSSSFYAPVAEPISPPKLPINASLNKIQQPSSVPNSSTSTDRKTENSEDDKRPQAMEALCMLEYYLSSIRQEKPQNNAVPSKIWSASSHIATKDYNDANTKPPSATPQTYIPSRRPKLWAPPAKTSQLKLPSPPPVPRQLPTDQFPSQSLTKEAFTKSLQPLQHSTPKPLPSPYAPQYTLQCPSRSAIRPATFPVKYPSRPMQCPLRGGGEEGSSSGEHEYPHGSSGYGGSEDVSDHASPVFSTWGKVGPDSNKKHKSQPSRRKVPEKKLPGRGRKNYIPCKAASRSDGTFRGVSFCMKVKLQDEPSGLMINAMFNCPRQKHRRARPRRRGQFIPNTVAVQPKPTVPVPTERHSRGRGRAHSNAGKQCASCSTRKTPLWRDAEDGTPLCNACGIRYKKYRLRCSSCWYIPRKDSKLQSQCRNCGEKLRIPNMKNKAW